MATAALSTRSDVRTQAPAFAGPVVLLGRLFFALIFLMAGPNHFSSQTIAYAASQGVPLASFAVPFSGVLAFLGGASIRVVFFVDLAIMAVLAALVYRTMESAEPQQG